MTGQTKLQSKGDVNAELGANNIRLQELNHLFGISDGREHSVGEMEIIGRLVTAYTTHLNMYDSGTAVLHVHFGWFDNRKHVIGGNETSYCAVFKKVTREHELLAGNTDIPNGHIEARKHKYQHQKQQDYDAYPDCRVG